jgi:hypothetical protein
MMPIFNFKVREQFTDLSVCCSSFLQIKDKIWQYLKIMKHLNLALEVIYNHMNIAVRQSLPSADRGREG